MIDKKNFYINGKWVAPKNLKEIKVIDPATEKECAVISLGGAEGICERCWGRCLEHDWEVLGRTLKGF